MPCCRPHDTPPRRLWLLALRALLVALILLLAVAASARGDGNDDGPKKEPDRLVADLASEDLAARQKAMKALEKAGEGALPALRKAARHADPDVCLRALVVIRAIRAATEGEDLVLKGHTGGVVSLDITPDGTLAVTGGNDRTARVWDLKTGRELRQLAGIRGNVWGLSVAPGGKEVLAGQATGDLSVHEVATGRLVRSFPKQTRPVRAVLYLPDGKRAVSASYDKLVRLLDVEKASELQNWSGHTVSPLSLAVSRDGKFALTGGGASVPKGAAKGGPPPGKAPVAAQDGSARLWDIAAGKLAFELPGHGERMLGVAFSPDGKHAATGSWDGKVRVWEATTGKLIATFPGTTKVFAVAFSPDGRWLVVGREGGGLAAHDPRSGKELRSFDGHTDAVSAVAFSADGKVMISGAKDSTVRVWRFGKR